LLTMFVAALVTRGKEFGVERVSRLRDTPNTTSVPLLAEWHDAWRMAVEECHGLPSGESEENTRTCCPMS
jgi:hypothetical protein